MSYIRLPSACENGRLFFMMWRNDGADRRHVHSEAAFLRPIKFFQCCRDTAVHFLLQMKALRTTSVN